MDHLCFLRLVFLMFSCLFIAALWSTAGKGLTSWLLLVMFIGFFLTSPCNILGQVWYLIVSFPDFCRLSYFYISRNVSCAFRVCNQNKCFRISQRKHMLLVLKIPFQ